MPQACYATNSIIFVIVGGDAKSRLPNLTLWMEAEYHRWGQSQVFEIDCEWLLVHTCVTAHVTITITPDSLTVLYLNPARLGLEVLERFLRVANMVSSTRLIYSFVLLIRAWSSEQCTRRHDHCKVSICLSDIVYKVPFCCRLATCPTCSVLLKIAAFGIAPALAGNAPFFLQ